MHLDFLIQAGFSGTGQLEHLYPNHYADFYSEFGIHLEGMWKYATEKNPMSLWAGREIGKD